MLERLLARRGALACVILLALLLQSPSLNTGFVADDHLQQIILRADRSGITGLPDSRYDLFTFAKTVEHTRQLTDQGLFPWTADETVRLAFFRPISSITHALDSSALMAHAHNLLWFALALIAAALFYRRIIGTPWIAALALTLYALDDARGPTVGWIANRNALCALAISLPSLILHDRWRKDRWLPGAWLAPPLLALALFAGESALATCAYLAAYALHLDRGKLATRLGTLVPYALIVVAWMVLYQKLGYGASGSGVYLDPAKDPLIFLRALPSRMSLLLLGQFALPWSDFAELYRYLSPRLATVIAVIAAGELALGAWIILPLLRRSAQARFFATGLMLAAIPICATFPADRLLSFVGIGGMGLVALMIAEPRMSRAHRVLVFILIAIHLVLAPPLAALRSRSMVTVDKPLSHANDTLPSDLAGKTLIIVNPPSDILTGYLQIMRASLGQARPTHLRALAAGTSPVAVERPDAHTLLVKPERGFLENVTEQMLRGKRRPLTAGSRVALTGMTADIVSLTADGRPAEVRFTFALPLDHPSLVWSAWLDGRYRPFTPPAIGARTTLPASDFIKAMFTIE